MELRLACCRPNVQLAATTCRLKLNDRQQTSSENMFTIVLTVNFTVYFGDRFNEHSTSFSHSRQANLLLYCIVLYRILLYCIVLYVDIYMALLTV